MIKSEKLSEETIYTIYEFGKHSRKSGEKLSDNHWDKNTTHRAAWDLGWNHQDQFLRLISEAETEFKNNQAREAEMKIISDNIFPTEGSL